MLVALPLWVIFLPLANDSVNKNQNILSVYLQHFNFKKIIPIFPIARNYCVLNLCSLLNSLFLTALFSLQSISGVQVLYRWSGTTNLTNNVQVKLIYYYYNIFLNYFLCSFWN